MKAFVCWLCVVLAAAACAADDFEPLFTFSKKDVYANCVSFSPDSKMLATSGGELAIWDTSTGKKLESFTRDSFHNDAGNALFTADGKTIVANGSFENSISRSFSLWDVATRKRTAKIQSEIVQIHAMAVSPDGKLIAVGGLNTSSPSSKKTPLEIWEIATRMRIAAFDPVDVSALAFSPDGKTLASGGVLGDQLLLWDVATGKKTVVVDRWSPIKTFPIVFSPDGKLLLTNGTGREGSFLTVLDAKSGKLIKDLKENDFCCTNCLAFSPNSQILAVGTVAMKNDTPFVIRLLDMSNVPDIRIIAHLPAESKWVTSVAISPNGKFLASVDSDGNGVVWDLAHIRKRTFGQPKSPPTSANAQDPAARPTNQHNRNEPKNLPAKGNEK